MRTRQLVTAVLVAAALAVGGVVSPAAAAEVTVSLSIPDASFGVNDDLRPDISFSVATPTAGTYDLSWWVENDNGSVKYPTTTLTSLSFAADTAQSFSGDLSGYPTGTWFLRTQLVNVNDTGISARDSGAFTIEAVAPHLTVTKASGTFYPVKDGYADLAVVRWSGEDVPGDLVVRNAANAVVATVSDGSRLRAWNGRTGSALAPEGAYTFELVLGSGDLESHYAAGTVTLSHKKLVSKTFKKTVTPVASMVGKYVGRCSTLKKPSDRGWKGSIGLYTRTRCRGTLKTTLIETDHAMRVPRAVRYTNLTISTYGGAAKRAPGSYAYLDMLNKHEQWGTDDLRLGSSLGTHKGWTKVASKYVFDQRFVIWGVYTALGAAYDVKSFTVVLTYKVLQ